MQEDLRRFRFRGPRDSYTPVQFSRGSACDLELLEAQDISNTNEYVPIPDQLDNLIDSQVSGVQHLREQYLFRINSRAISVASVPDLCNTPIGPPSVADCHSASGILAWYKADVGISASNGQSVQLWQDQSGNGNNAARLSNGGDPVDTLNVPVYNTSIPGGGPVVSFKNLNAGLDISGITVLRSSYTFYFLIRYNINQGDTSIILSATSVHGGFLIQGDTPLEAGSPSVDHFFSGNTFVEGPSSICGWQVLTVVVDSVSGTNSLYRNGVLIDQQSYTVDGSTDTAWSLGDPGFGLGFVFDTAEILLYNTAHSSSTVNTESTCLLSRWNIT